VWRPRPRPANVERGRGGPSVCRFRRTSAWPWTHQHTAAPRRAVAVTQLSSRVGRARMPAALRTTVLALVAQVGVYRAAADLELSYSTLSEALVRRRAAAA